MSAIQQCMRGSRIFSGIQPTGVPHLGNYFGAIKQWIDIGQARESVDQQSIEKKQKPVFCIVDLHSLTAPPPQLPSSSERKTNDDTVNTRSYQMLASLLACGLDPRHCVIFRQSQVLEHTYLAWILACHSAMGRVSQLTQYKEKSARFKSQGIPVALFTYPILQAADILLYRADQVPVGADQAQHIEFTRDIARKFNITYNCQLFRDPSILSNASRYAERVRSLRDPTKKMSKSDANARSRIEIIAEPDEIYDRCRKALTDSKSEISYDPIHRPAVANLINIYALVTGETHDQIYRRHAEHDVRQLKQALADAMIDHFAPIRTRYKEYIGDLTRLDSILDEGAREARVIARDTLDQVNKVIGV